MAIQSAFYFTDGTTRTFPSTKHIASSTNVAVWMKRVVDDVWELTSYELWTLANNSIVFTVAPQSTVYSQIELRIADESDELTESPSNIALVAGSIANVDTVATNISAVNTVSTNITAVQNTSANATNINTVATNIANVNTVVTNIANVNTTASNIANVNTVASDLLEPISEINTVATNIANVNTVGLAITAVNTVSTNITAVQNVSANATNINTVSTNIANVNAVGHDITKVNTVATNITNVNAVCSNIANVNTTATNIADINNVVIQVIPNLSEILLADDNATIATNKALEASGSATIATNKALEASGSATIATNKALEASNSATTATTKAGEALTSANNAYASEVQAGIYAAQAQESALIISPENYVQTTGDETIAGVKTFSSTVAGSINGNSATATKLATARTINGVSFDGTANITIPSIPTGGIIMWSGSIVSIPTGWALCNGQNGTPNLQDRFVIGAGSAYGVGSTGGSKDAIVVAHTHSGSTSSDGEHNHSSTVPKGYYSNSGDGYGGLFGTSPTTQRYTNYAGAHSHSLNINGSGESGIDKNLPPYYALAYIMKI